MHRLHCVHAGRLLGMYGRGVQRLFSVYGLHRLHGLYRLRRMQRLQHLLLTLKRIR
jgi:hypothetical protein